MYITSVILMLLVTSGYGFDQNTDWNEAQSLHDFKVIDLHDNEISLDKYRGNVVVFATLATKCPVSQKNLKLLQGLQEKYGESDGLKIVAFMVDGVAQSSGSQQDIQEYVKNKKITFDVYGKVSLDDHPVFKWIRSQPNVEKYFVAGKILFDKDGKIINVYPPTGPLTEMDDTMKQYF